MAWRGSLAVASKSAAFGRPRHRAACNRNGRPAAAGSRPPAVPARSTLPPTAAAALGCRVSAGRWQPDRLRPPMAPPGSDAHCPKAGDCSAGPAGRDRPASAGGAVDADAVGRMSGTRKPWNFLTISSQDTPDNAATGMPTTQANITIARIAVPADDCLMGRASLHKNYSRFGRPPCLPAGANILSASRGGPDIRAGHEHAAAQKSIPPRTDDSRFGRLEATAILPNREIG